MALTKDDWLKHYEVSEKIEAAGMEICNLQEEIEYLDPDCEEVKELESQIVDLEEEIKELRKDLIPTTPEGDSVESLQDEFDTTPRPQF